MCTASDANFGLVNMRFHLVVFFYLTDFVLSVADVIERHCDKFKDSVCKMFDSALNNASLAHPLTSCMYVCVLMTDILKHAVN